MTVAPAQPGDADARRRVYPVFLLVLVVFAVGLPLASAELLLRSRGYTAWRPYPRGRYQPTTVEPDPVMLWRNKPGHYDYPGYTPDEERITLTIEENGSRSVGFAPTAPRARLAFVGDSITLGAAISDDETFAWKLQHRFPDVAFANYGVSGYGTYQSLLMMRRILAENPPPDLILYGFYNDHLQRNVQSYEWVAIHDHNTRGVISPYCTVDAAGHLVEHAPEPLPRWPLRDVLASVYFLEQRYLRPSADRRAADAWPVAKLLLSEMDRAARERGVRFAVVVLMSRPAVSRQLMTYLHANGIRVVDCERKLKREWKVVNEGHPNGLMNTEWADCLGAALPALLSEAKPR
jgi:hypothetical protein